ncbi:MAG: adenylate/guanylate cyclase domain-containing protein [Pirellulales bacterium]
MADLIAQGPEPQHRWRRTIRPGERFLIGRAAGPWTVTWDERISRQHAELAWTNGRLTIHKLPAARNPVFVSGRESADFSIRPGEHFVIGQTTFTLTNDLVQVSLAAPHPVEEQTFSAQYLRRIRFHNADHRIDVLSRLPDLISGAANEHELFVRLVNMLLAGIPRASTVALVQIDENADADSPVDILHWDRRLASSGDFQPSQRLIVEGIRRKQSVLHVWSGMGEASRGDFTLQENVDWAFCTPVLGEGSDGWGLYVTGRFGAAPTGTPASVETTDLREDLKFTELVSATLGSLLQLRGLQRKHSALSQFFAPAVLEAMAAEDPNVVLAPRETEVSVLFCDLRGFSFEAEKNSSDLLGLLQRVSKALGVMTHHILDQGGVVGDFQGDAAMGFWGWPFPQADAIQRAALAALAIRTEFEAAARRPGHPLANFRMGIGLSTGRAVAGRIGTTDQVKVTVFGPVVNLASRLEGMTKFLHTPILIDEATARFVREKMPPQLARCRRLAVVRPYGLGNTLEVSELLPPETEFPDLTNAHLAAYEQALDTFLAGNWQESLERLHEVPAKDRVKDFLTVFIAQHNRTPPPGWDGVIPLSSKG